MYGRVAGVKALAGVEPEDLGLETRAELDELITTWLEELTAQFNVVLCQSEITPEDSKYLGISLLAQRKCADLIALAIQKATEPIVQIDDFAVSVVDSSTVFTNLTQELLPYQQREIGVIL